MWANMLRAVPVMSLVSVKWLIWMAVLSLTCAAEEFKTAAGAKESRCGPKLNILWSREVSHVPFAASPLLADVDADGRVDVVAAAFSGEVHVLHGEAGQLVETAGWPHKIQHGTVHASPLQMDIDRDGMLDIVICTSEGELIFIDHVGNRIANKEYQVPTLAVQADWYTRQLALDQISIHEYILDEPPTDPEVASKYVMVDPHVLCTPVLADLNRDGVTEELLIAVSYYFEQDYYLSHPDALEEKGIPLSQLDKYLASALLVLNTTSMQPIRTLHLELSKVESEYPGYALYSPTVVDLDSDGSELEVVLGTSAGQIHVFGWGGGYREGFPIPTDSLSGQILVEDVNQDHALDIIATDVSGNVMCYTAGGAIQWESQVSGTAVTGIRVTDLDGNKHLEMVLATNDGNVWVLSGQSGQPVDGWPVRVARSLQAPPLIVQLDGQRLPSVAVIGDDSHLHLLSTDSSCRRTLNLWEKSYVAMASHDLNGQSGGLELVVASQDGTVLCLGQLSVSGEAQGTETVSPSATWPAETRSHNDFTYLPAQRGVVIHRTGQATPEYTGSSFTLTFTVHGSLPAARHQYLVQVLLGSQLLHSETLPTAGTYTLTVSSPQVPVFGHLVLRCYNQHGQLFTDAMPVRFHTSVTSDLKWLFLSPVLGMGVLLLVLHGFPDVDLLPVTLPGKAR